MALWLLYGWWEYERSDFAACYGVYGISGIFHDLPASKKPLDGRFSWWSLCWGCYLLMFDVTQHIFASGLVASAFAAVYAEIFARKKMAPTLLFVIPFSGASDSGKLSVLYNERCCQRKYQRDF